MGNRIRASARAAIKMAMADRLLSKINCAISAANGTSRSLGDLNSSPEIRKDYEMRRFAIVVTGMGFLMAAGSLMGCIGRSGVATKSAMYEKLPYRSSTYSGQIDQIMRAKTGYPW
jgi:hypothetical protein